MGISPRKIDLLDANGAPVTIDFGGSVTWSPQPTLGIAPGGAGTVSLVDHPSTGPRLEVWGIHNGSGCVAGCDEDSTPADGCPGASACSHTYEPGEHIYCTNRRLTAPGESCGLPHCNKQAGQQIIQYRVLNQTWPLTWSSPAWIQLPNSPALPNPSDYQRAAYILTHFDPGGDTYLYLGNEDAFVCTVANIWNQYRGSSLQAVEVDFVP
jgi:hypothetical protein